MRKIFKNPIFYIILFALLLRLSSVFFALPYADVFGDELPHTITTFKILNAKSLILPFEFNHYLPPLYSYLLLPIYGLIGVLGLIFNVFVSLADFKEFVILYREWFLAPGRILSAFFGAGTVYLIYLFAKKLFNKKVALLSQKNILIFTDFQNDNFFSGKVRKIELTHRTQKEAVCFKNNDTLFLSDEKSNGEGGNLYTLKL